MFRKLRIQMTLFAAAITGGILAVLGLACLFMSESEMKETAYSSFVQNTASCISYLDGRSVLPYSWTGQVKADYGIITKIQDNDILLAGDEYAEGSQEEIMLREAVKIAKEKEGLDVENGFATAVTKTARFTAKDFYGCTVLIPRDGGVLRVVMVLPLDSLHSRIFHQRLAFGGLILLGILLLFVFSWFFTGKLIKPLEKSRGEQTRFIAAASHELRSPLAVILSSLEVMEGSDEATRSHLTAVIEKEGKRMARLVEEMLSLANADNHTLTLRLSECEPDTLVLEVYEKYEALLAKKKIRLQVSLPGEPVFLCRLDEARISQLLGILLDNCASYVPAGGLVRLSLQEEDRELVILTSDNGPGISPEKRESVFERFFRADTARGEKQHFGLGLSIAREIAELHHGTLTAEETLGGGATFVLRLPKSL